MSRYCLENGCDQEVESGRCPEHYKTVDGDKDKRIKARTAEQRKVYKTARWRGVRRSVLREHPWCQNPGCNQMATDVDHVKPLAQGGDPYDRSNLQALCHAHHSAKTWQETLFRG